MASRTSKHPSSEAPSYWARVLSAALATLLVWGPMAPQLVRAQDPDSIPPPEDTDTVDLSGDLEDPGVVQDEPVEGPDDGEMPAESSGQGATTQDDSDAEPLGLPGAEARTSVSPQAISLPDAEGSVEGMGESFAPILSSGTATFSVPIAVAPGRAGVQPSLSLSYSSTNGNGPLGFGWGMGVPFISRQSDRGMPRYVDRPEYHGEEDRFMYNGGQELVPVDSETIAAIDQLAAGEATVSIPAELATWQQYRARIEGAFMRFFRSPDSTRWVVQSRDGTRFDFGLLPDGQGPSDVTSISDRSLEINPESERSRPQVYRWCLTRMSDSHGSTVYYTYRVDGNQSYIESIYHISPQSCASGTTPAARRACTAPVSSYGARVRVVYQPREDVWSSYATGWRMDTALRVRRIEVTAWNDTLNARALVRRYHLRYDPDTFHSLLSEVQVEGRPELAPDQYGIVTGNAGVAEGSLGDSVVGQTLPAMRFGYSTMPSQGEVIPGFGGLDPSIHEVENSPPHSFDEARADLFDVNTDGLPDLIVTDPARYRTREGEPAVGVFFNGFDGPSAIPAGRTRHFSEAVPMPMDSSLSSVMSLSNLNIVPMDIDGDGRSDMLHMPRQREYGWFTPTRGQDSGAVPASPAGQNWRWTYVPVQLPAGDTDPRIDLGRDSSHLEIVDVNNDHLIDVVRTTGTVMQTWLNLGWLPGGEGRFGSYSFTPGAAVQNGWVLSTQPVESCLLQSGRPVDFDDPEVRLSDMNGDGLLDIVEMRRGSVRYWPGRGEASWGDGDYECPRGRGANRYIDMASPPQEINVELDGVSLMDVNMDGASDVVQIRFDAIDVWFNRAGRGFTRRTIARGTPPTPSYFPRTRTADIDGSGTTDIVWGNARNWQYVDLAGGHRPRLLVRVENGLGAQTDIGYGSSAEDYVRDLAEAHTCTAPSCERFTWGQATGDPSDFLATRARNGAGRYRSDGSPVLSQVVRSVSTSDRLNVLGRQAQVSTTHFAYHDGYYEGIEQEFRGFGAADAGAIGDWNHPTSFTRTWFNQGRRPQSVADSRLEDNPNEALKGREFLTETFDERGRYLSSAHATLTSRDILAGLDGTMIQYAYVSEANELRYDTTLWEDGGDTVLPLVDVSYERLTGTTWTRTATQTRNARIRARVGGAGQVTRIRTTYDDVDSLGQVRVQIAHGHVSLMDAAAIDPEITSRTLPALVASESGWLWRTRQTSLDGGADPVTGAPINSLRVTRNAYAADTGDLLVSIQELGGQRSYRFGNETSGEGGARGFGQNTDPGNSLHPTARTSYDAWGNAVASCALGATAADPNLLVLPLEGQLTPPTQCLRFGRVSYDAAFGQFALEETAYVTPTRSLSTRGTWDRGLGAVLTATDPNNLLTRVEYDGLGRLVAVMPPDIEGCVDGAQGAPTTTIAYALTPDGRTQPVSTVTTTTWLDCSGADSLVSIAYIDGLGRPRAALATGDTDSHWLRSRITTLDTKGTVRRAYQPDYYGGPIDRYSSILAIPQGATSATGFPTFGANDIPYTVIRYDAFGRTIGVHAEDGSYTSQSYHTLSTDVCDALDNDPSSPFYRTCTTSRSDGHGRVIDQILRTYDSEGQPEQHRLWSYYRNDGVVTHLVRARSTTDRPNTPPPTSLTTVQRVFHYDSLGRRIGTDDPDTDRRGGAAADRRTWRYLFNPVGDLVAVRDPRSCGQNFYYDLAGRLLGEQYVSCDEATSSAAERPGVTVPGGSIDMGRRTGASTVDVRYYYDTYDDLDWASHLDPENRSVGGPLGRALGVEDRGQRSVVAYDRRGNAIWTARQMAIIPDAQPLTAVARAAGDDRPQYREAAPQAGTIEYDEAHDYVRTSRFDHANRGVAIVLPIDYVWAPDSQPLGGTLEYNNRGLPTQASIVQNCDPVENGPDSCMDVTPVIEEIDYDRDGLPRRTQLGGPNPIVSTVQYDIRRRPVRMTTVREPTPGSALRSLGGVTAVVDQQLVWDVASNLIETVDHRDPLEWPAGHRPQSTFIMHDALYRVISASFSYTQDDGRRTTGDMSSDWRNSQRAIREANADPMDQEPAPMVPEIADQRVGHIEWEWDWLGNTQTWNDDADSFYERSIGNIVNGNDEVPGNPNRSLRPSALYLSTSLPQAPTVISDQDVTRNGWLELEYGFGGNVTSMTVHGQCRPRPTVDVTACYDPIIRPLDRRLAHLRANCECRAEQYYEYRWDELNRLSEARRWDRSHPAPTWSIAVRQRYRYDGANGRSIKQTLDSQPSSETQTAPPGAHNERVALYVYPGNYEVRGLRRSNAGNEYIAAEGSGGHVETQYVIAGARWVETDENSELRRDRRLMTGVADLLQTTAATVDLLSGELVEASTYYPNGARETLLIDQDDPSATEPMGFTGKDRDEEVGLTYFGERYLIARLGRWATPDPWHINTAGGGEPLNAYHYCAGRNFDHRDSDGMLPTAVAGAIVGAVIGGAVEAGMQYLSGEQLSWQQRAWRIGTAMAGGAVAGGLAGATMGASLAGNMVVGAVANVAGGTLTRSLHGEATTAGHVLVEGVLGAAAAPLARVGVAGLRRMQTAAQRAANTRIGRELEARWAPRLLARLRGGRPQVRVRPRRENGLLENYTFRADVGGASRITGRPALQEIKIFRDPSLLTENQSAGFPALERYGGRVERYGASSERLVPGTELSPGTRVQVVVPYEIIGAVAAESVIGGATAGATDSPHESVGPTSIPDADDGEDPPNPRPPGAPEGGTGTCIPPMHRVPDAPRQ